MSSPSDNEVNLRQEFNQRLGDVLFSNIQLVTTPLSLGGPRDKAA